ncbi:hypothetical protein FJZ21_04045 [Candidatus Pacearchaeota archaeon]|nr:hypothetical protein [Candidatus Pacearchaeota archaeon]
MKNTILAIILVLAIIFAVAAVIFYNVQDYEYSLDLEETISTDKIFVKLSPEAQLYNAFGGLINNSIAPPKRNMQSFSTTLGKMTFENKGALSRVVEIPRLVACLDLGETAIFSSTNTIPTYSSEVTAYWTVYTTNEPNFNNLYPNVPQIYSNEVVNEIYPQYNYARYGNQPAVEVKKGDKLTYYISLRDSYLYIEGNNSKIFKNAEIRVYEIPMKFPNPLSDGANYDIFAYNPTCNVLSKDFEPLKTIKVV